MSLYTPAKTQQVAAPTPLKSAMRKPGTPSKNLRVSTVIESPPVTTFKNYEPMTETLGKKRAIVSIYDDMDANSEAWLNGEKKVEKARMEAEARRVRSKMTNRTLDFSSTDAAVTTSNNTNSKPETSWFWSYFGLRK